MNEAVREYARNYICPVKMFHLDLESAMKEWEE